MDVKLYLEHPRHANHSLNNEKKESFSCRRVIPRHLRAASVMECSIRIKCVTKRCRLEWFQAFSRVIHSNKYGYFLLVLNSVTLFSNAGQQAAEPRIFYSLVVLCVKSEWVLRTFDLKVVIYIVFPEIV